MIRRSQSQASTATPSPPKPSTSSAKKTSKKEDAADGVERYDKFYAKFERPPFAQIYRPTEEEFLDPIAYVAKIRHEAERYGVVKIVPPPSFKPPFALDRDAFTFRPRIQRLNEIEAIVKEKATFIERVVNYNRMNGYSDYVAIDPHGHPIDLHHLHKVVTALKGFDVVTKQCKWADVAEKVCRPARSVPPQYDKFLRSHYADHIIGFLNNVKDEDKDLMYASDEDESADRHKYQHHHGIKVKAEDDDDDVKPESPCSPTMQAGFPRDYNFL